VAALSAAGVAADQIDLITTLCISPSHIAARPQLIGPRFGYMVQRQLGITRAFVLDLIDASWIFAIDQTALFTFSRQYRTALLIRAECFVAASGNPAILADGAAALVLRVPAQPAPGAYHTVGPAPLLRIVSGGGAPGSHMVLEGPSAIPDLAALAPAAWLPAGADILVERWHGPGCRPFFDLAEQLAAARPARRGHAPAFLVGLDPFKARLGKIEVMI
jgi:hypothetical protein